MILPEEFNLYKINETIYSALDAMEDLACNIYAGNVTISNICHDNLKIIKILHDKLTYLELAIDEVLKLPGVSE